MYTENCKVFILFKERGLNSPLLSPGERGYLNKYYLSFEFGLDIAKELSHMNQEEIDTVLHIILNIMRCSCEEMSDEDREELQREREIAIGDVIKLGDTFRLVYKLGEDDKFTRVTYYEEELGDIMNCFYGDDEIPF